MSGSTLGDLRDPAEVCRSNGWGVGTELVGDEGYGPSVIRITAVGERSILARRVWHGGHVCNERENLWVLDCRDWTVRDVPPSGGVVR